jgi:hypothetical protein
MPTQTITSTKSRSQSQRFIDKARELGCDEDEAAFEERLRKIAKTTPPVPRKDIKPEKKKPRQGRRG